MKTKEEIQKVIDGYEKDVDILLKQMNSPLINIGQFETIQKDIDRINFIIGWLEWVLK